MKRGARVWLLFGACVALTCAAMAWVSVALLRIDAAERQVRADAAFEERVRLALWRMDAQAAAILAAEAAIPPGQYVSAPVANDFVTERFEIAPDGELAFAAAVEAVAPAIVVPNAELARLPEIAAASTPSQSQTIEPQVFQQQLADRGQQGALRPAEQVLMENDMRQQRAGQSEYQARQRAVGDGYSALNRANFAIDAQSGPMAPLWVGGRLLLARRVAMKGAAGQGCVLDIDRLHKSLLAEASELLPEARLSPTRPDDSENRRLVALPLTLEPGRVGGLAIAASGAVQPLVIAWIGVLLAAIASAALLRGVMRLSERRAAFVSAVTHELRTPLTTFRLYTEMLRDGMTLDATQRDEYLSTLNNEAERLTHLVENVLAYARLERQSLSRRAEPTSVGDLLRRMQPRLEARAEEAGLALRVDVAPQLPNARTVASAVEQIVVNLVDNACKYASRGATTDGSADGGDVLVAVSMNGRFVEVRVRDRGPGISAARRAHVFEPFHKSAEEAAGAAPGVGIGLSLSRRLARDLGGELELEPSAVGASFVLRLPVARAD
ncbi:MAG: HAMP domain-containing histidine kinase [Phycisphaerales bacterium]|nr:HAMP domain-containing histidine kinase [Phycisphaerales bacterium]